MSRGGADRVPVRSIARGLLAAACVATLLGGCAAGGKRYVYLHDTVREGDRLIVERALRARGILSKEVILRDGRPIGIFSADQRETRCVLRVFDLPESDTVERAVYEIERVRSNSYGGSSADETETVTRLDLAGAGSTSGGYLECRRTIDSSDFQSVPSYITLAETRRAVGPYITFETSGGDPIDGSGN
jgi:hypothetical protein